MIKTTTQVSYDPINPSKTAIVFAQVTSALRNDVTETYTLNIKEWIEINYTAIVPISSDILDEEGVIIGTTETMEERTFTKTQTVRRQRGSYG